ncbi:hypothetical protein GCM10010332_73970 [Streptomyces albogriseolus]|nr:hypothetical protein GCM10010332_73970 [Streptomyces albogriseolus]
MRARTTARSGQLEMQDDAQVLLQPSPEPQASTIGTGDVVTVVVSSQSTGKPSSTGSVGC